MNIFAKDKQYLGQVPGMIGVDDVFIRQHGEEYGSLELPRAVRVPFKQLYGSVRRDSHNGFSVRPTALSGQCSPLDCGDERVWFTQ